MVSQLPELVTQLKGNPVLLARLAKVMLARGKRELATAICDQSMVLAPENRELRAVASEIFSHDIPRWYFAMVLDDLRNRLYDAAFRSGIPPGSLVLDVGTGTGLFAMMAARAGASKVITCERRIDVATAATAVIRKNHLDDRIAVIAKPVSELEIGVDIDRPADVVIWDNLSNNLIGADALESLERVARRLARPGARFIPAKGKIIVALAEDKSDRSQRMSFVEGFDLTPFNRLAAPNYNMIDADRFVVRSAPTCLFEFDFESGGPFPSERARVELNALGGAVNGVAQWLCLELGHGGKYENRPPTFKTAALAAVFYPAGRSFSLAEDSPVIVAGSHDRSTMQIWIES